MSLPLSRQVWELFRAMNRDASERKHRRPLWLRLRGLLSEAALDACARAGEACWLIGEGGFL